MKIDLEKKFKEETGFDAYIDNDLRPKVYRYYYVEWLEEQLKIYAVVGQSEQFPQNFCTLNQKTCGKGSRCKYPHCHL